MARRDVRRHKGRSALIVVMVALPTLLLTFGLTLGATSQTDGVELIPERMGSGQADVAYPVTERLEQNADGSSTSSSGTATPVPGWVAGGSAVANAGAVSALTGARAVPYLHEDVSTRIDERRIRLTSLAIDGRAGLGDKVRLLSGRWPTSPTETLVSSSATRQGVPDQGRLTVHAGDRDVDLEVVGTVRALGEYGLRYDLVVPQPFDPEMTGGGWVLTDTGAVTWDEVRRLNGHGFEVVSAAVLRDPPAAGELPREIQQQEAFNQDRMGTFVALAGALLLIVTTLLVGPAFAVSAARQRRTLALAASNGATTSQLRHTVLAQAVVLGVASALLGASLGVLLTRLVVAWAPAFLGGLGPFDIPWGAVTFITVAAAASAVIAALLPARRLGRLDIIGVMKGQSVSPRPSRLVLLAGIVLTVVGGGAVLALARSQGASEVSVVAATTALIIGAVMLTPMTLVVLAAASARLPVPLRMATRDAGRQRARSVPSIAAIIAGVAVLTMILIATGSDEEQSRREYAPQNALGDLTVMGNPTLDVDALRTAVARVKPGLLVSPVSVLDTGDPWLTSTRIDDAPPAPYDQRVLNVVPPGCTVEKTVTDTIEPGEDDAGGDRCHRLGTQGQAGSLSGIGVVPTEEITRRLALLGREGDAERVRDGSVVVARLPGTPSLLTDGKVTLATGTQRVTSTENEQTTGPLTGVRQVTLPAFEVSIDQDTLGTFLVQGMLVPEPVAKTAGWPLVAAQVTVHDPAGPISKDLSERIGFVVDDRAYVATERGFESPMRYISAALIAIFTLLLLVITLTSTALTLAEQERDQATLAALGSGRGTRRIMAAAQAFTLTLVGSVLGVLVGIVPGVALAYPLTAQTYDPITGMGRTGDPVLVLPWLVLLGFAVVVPLVASGLAAAGIRKAPDATHRAA